MSLSCISPRLMLVCAWNVDKQLLENNLRAAGWEAGMLSTVLPPPPQETRVGVSNPVHLDLFRLFVHCARLSQEQVGVVRSRSFGCEQRLCPTFGSSTGGSTTPESSKISSRSSITNSISLIVSSYVYQAFNLDSTYLRRNVTIWTNV